MTKKRPREDISTLSTQCDKHVDLQFLGVLTTGCVLMFGKSTQSTTSVATIRCASCSLPPVRYNLLDIIIKNWNVDWSCLHALYPYTCEKEDREECKLCIVTQYNIAVHSQSSTTATVACSIATRAACVCRWGLSPHSQFDPYDHMA